MTASAESSGRLRQALRERALPESEAPAALASSFHLETCGDIVIVVVREWRLRARHAALLAQVLDRYPEQTRLVLDVSQVLSVDSFALAALLQFGTDRVVRLVGLGPTVHTLFDDLGILLALRPAASVLDAVAELMET